MVVSVIVSSSSTVATADADHAHGRFLFLSQTLPDNSQSIIKRIGEHCPEGKAITGGGY
jgi:hypothetical protein